MSIRAFFRKKVRRKGSWVPEGASRFEEESRREAVEDRLLYLRGIGRVRRLDRGR
jgi:hypothetical protein